MRVAVTGASGFLGRYVLKELASSPHLQIVATSRTNRDFGRPHPAVRVVELDLASPPADSYERLGRPELLVHLAWSGLPNYRSTAHFENQLSQQYRFLRGLVEAGLPSLLCTGTCFEYGMRSGELDESMCSDPANPYGYAKDALRRQLQFLRAARPFQLTWTRLFYMFGEGQPASSLYPAVMAAIERGDESFPMSPGDQLRDYLHVSEVSRNIAALALRAPDSGIVNVCSGKPVAIRSLVAGWLRERGSPMRLDLGRYPYADHEPMAFWGSARRLSSLLGASAGTP